MRWTPQASRPLTGVRGSGGGGKVRQGFLKIHPAMNVKTDQILALGVVDEVVEDGDAEAPGEGTQ